MALATANYFLKWLSRLIPIKRSDALTATLGNDSGSIFLVKTGSVLSINQQILPEGLCYIIGTLRSNCRVGQRAFALFSLIKPYVRFSLIRLSDILLSTALRHAAISCKPFSCNRSLVAYSPFSFRVC